MCLLSLWRRTTVGMEEWGWPLLHINQDWHCIILPLSLRALGLRDYENVKTWFQCFYYPNNTPLPLPPCPRGDLTQQDHPPASIKIQSSHLFTRVFSHTWKRPSVFNDQRLFCNPLGYHPTETPAEIRTFISLSEVSCGVNPCCVRRVQGFPLSSDFRQHVSDQLLWVAAGVVFPDP